MGVSISSETKGVVSDVAGIVLARRNGEQTIMENYGPTQISLTTGYVSSKLSAKKLPITINKSNPTRLNDRLGRPM